MTGLICTMNGAVTRCNPVSPSGYVYLFSGSQQVFKQILSWWVLSNFSLTLPWIWTFLFSTFLEAVWQCPKSLMKKVLLMIIGLPKKCTKLFCGRYIWSRIQHFLPFCVGRILELHFICMPHAISCDFDLSLNEADLWLETSEIFLTPFDHWVCYWLPPFARI